MQKTRSTAREYLEALLVAGLFLTFTNTWVLKTFFIPSGSMLNTLLIGDHLIVNRFIYAGGAGTDASALLPHRSLLRGDLVVFRSPVEPTMDLVKRCVAVAGDTVQLRDKRLFLNGQPVAEPYVVHTDARVGGVTSLAPELTRRDQFGPYRVPADHYFCMGDNRDQSYDSRFWGPLPVKYVKGRPGLIYWSYAGDPPPVDAASSAARFRHFGRTALGFATKTRWSRTFALPR